MAHVTLVIIFDCFVVWEHVHTFSDPLIGWTLLFGSLWLVAGPLLLVTWERRRSEMDDSLSSILPRSGISFESLYSRSRSVDKLAPLIVSASVLLLGTAYLFNGVLVNSQHLGVNPHEFFYYFGLFVILVGAFAAGWGILAAVETLVVAVYVARNADDYQAYAGTESPVAKAIARFCFLSACIFGAGGAIVLPGVCATAASSSNLPQYALIVLAILIVAATTALLAVPAYFLSQRNDELRRKTLDDLSVHLRNYANIFEDGDVEVSDVDSMRLQGLLELRRHLVAYPQPDPAVQMVKNIPLVVLLPVVAVAAAWLGIVLPK